MDRPGDFLSSSTTGDAMTNVSTDLTARLTELAKIGSAPSPVVSALFLLQGFREDGRACTGCATLHRGDAVTCRPCREPTEPRELGEAMVDRVLATGGRADLRALAAYLASPR